MGKGHGAYRRQVRVKGKSTQDTDNEGLLSGGRLIRYVRLMKGRGVWKEGQKGKEEITGLRRSRARAMDPAIYPTSVTLFYRCLILHMRLMPMLKNGRKSVFVSFIQLLHKHSICHIPTFT
jgi:hypothetical protein